MVIKSTKKETRRDVTTDAIAVRERERETRFENSATPEKDRGLCRPGTGDPSFNDHSADAVRRPKKTNKQKQNTNDKAQKKESHGTKNR